MATNPPWSDRAVESSWEAIEAALTSSGIPEEWMPQGDLAELGCGHYGCVYPTGDPKIVFKVTTDPSEANFVANYLRLRDSGVLSLGVVQYYEIFGLPMQHRGRRIYVLWREEVPHVSCRSIHRFIHDQWQKKNCPDAPCQGFERSYEYREFSEFEKLLMKFKNNAHVAKIVADRKAGSVDADSYWAWMSKQMQSRWETNKLTDWQFEAILGGRMRYPYKFALLAKQCEYTAQELGSQYYGVNVGQALETYLDAGLFLADVHCGNIGLQDESIQIDERQSYAPIITDPGHAVLLKRELENPPILMLDV
jgi:hypothetical protein